VNKGERKEEEGRVNQRKDRRGREWVASRVEVRVLVKEAKDRRVEEARKGAVEEGCS
jgi:hypothetical protein